MKLISIEEGLDAGATIIDVRSPREYLHSHIPGAVNIPILDDYSHKEVGTIYRQLGKEAAIAKGIELTSPVLNDIYHRFSQIPGPLMVHCARGGMRSQSIAHVLHSFGRDVSVVEGGYKAYREYVLRQMDEEIRRRTFVVLQGHTGIGKTHILQELRKLGYGTIDLEALAHHAGSVFGHLAFREEQPSQKQFENELFNHLRALPKIVLLERESRKIGRLFLPNALVQAIQDAKHILLSSPLEQRVSTILEDYHPEWQARKPELKNALDQLKARLSAKVIDELKEQIDRDEFEPVIRYLMEYYYDPLYQHSVRYQSNDYVLECYFETREEAIEQITTFINHLS